MNLKLDNETKQRVPEQRFLLHGVAWTQYETLRSTLDNIPGLRLTYLEGMLELFMPSEEHEEVKKLLARMLEWYALERGIRLYAFGSATYRKQATARGLEPDECYYVETKKEFPDIAIEIVLTSGLLDKLEVYRGLGVPEVWVWQAGSLAIYRLRGDRYEQMTQSEFLPELDLNLLVRCASMPDQHDAIVAFRDALRQR